MVNFDRFSLAKARFLIVLFALSLSAFLAISPALYCWIPSLNSDREGTLRLAIIALITASDSDKSSESLSTLGGLAVIWSSEKGNRGRNGSFEAGLWLW